MNFNVVDIALFLIVLASVWGGWYRGFILGLADLARWVGSFLAALFLYQTAARWLSSLFGWSDVGVSPLLFF